MATPPILTEGTGAVGLEAYPGYIALEGGIFTGGGIMPNLIGQLLWDAIALLQAAGILVPASIGYFGTYPISVLWVPATINRGVVIAQPFIAGVPVKPNTPIVLTVNDYPVSVAFP